MAQDIETGGQQGCLGDAVKLGCLWVFPSPGSRKEGRKETSGDGHVWHEPSRRLLHLKCMAQRVLDCRTLIKNMLLHQRLMAPQLSILLVRRDAWVKE